MTTIAVVFGDQGQPELRDLPMPQPKEDEILVRVRAVGLDSSGAAAGAYGYAGTVEEVGSRVTKELKKGDRVAGVARGAADGVALAEYVAAKGDLQMIIPDRLGDAEAAALGGPLSLVCQALYAALQLPLPPASWFAPQSILIHGGDTPAGRLGIQFARRSGLHVLATRGGGGGGGGGGCSDGTRADGENEKGEEALRALGAAAVLDAAAPACAAEVRAQSRDRLTLAWDCTGTGAALCAAALSATEPGVYYATPPASGGGGAGGSPEADVLAAANPRVATPREVPAAVAAATARVYSATAGADDADAEDAHELARGFWAAAETLLADGDLAAAAPEVNRGGDGLEGVRRRLEALRGNQRDDGEAGAAPLVYTL